MSDALTPKQKLFVEEYLKDLNATKAAERAKFSQKHANRIASQLLAKPHVANAIQEAMQKRSKRNEITQDQVLEELSRVAFANMGSIATWNESGVTFKPSDQLTPEQIASVAEVNESTNQHGGTLKIKQYDKVKALELLGRHLGMWNDKLDMGNGDRPLKELSDAELLKKLRGNG